MKQQQPDLQQSGQLGQQQLGLMQDSLLNQQQTQQQNNLGFNQQSSQFNEQNQMFNDINAMNQPLNQQQQQNKMMDPMLNAIDQQQQQLRIDPVTGQPIFNQPPSQQQSLMDNLNQQQNQMMNKQFDQQQQFDPITGLPITNQFDLNKQNQLNQQAIGFDQMNNLGQPIDSMLNKQFNEINNNLLIEDKMKQGPQFPNQQQLNQQLNQPLNQQLNQQLNQPLNQSSNQQLNQSLNQQQLSGQQPPLMDPLLLAMQTSNYSLENGKFFSHLLLNFFCFSCSFITPFLFNRKKLNFFLCFLKNSSFLFSFQNCISIFEP